MHDYICAQSINNDIVAIDEELKTLRFMTQNYKSMGQPENYYEGFGIRVH